MKKLIYSILLVLVMAACTTTTDKTSTKNDLAMMGEKIVLEGNLIDVWCGESGNGMDGSDVANSPQDHSKKCLVACEEGGYGISVADGDAYKFIAFADAQSNEKSVALIKNTTKEKDIKIKVSGYMVEDKLHVESITEIDAFSMM